MRMQAQPPTRRAQLKQVLIWLSAFLMGAVPASALPIEVTDSISIQKSARSTPDNPDCDSAGGEPEADEHPNESLSILDQLNFLGNSIPAILRPLAPIRSFASAPFAKRSKERLEVDEMDHVRIGGTSPQATTLTTGNGLRIVIWNIERGLQYDKILRILREELIADIYILQEVDLFARRTDFRDIASDIAAELGLSFAYGVEFQELTQGKPGQPALHGQATLSRFPIRDARVLRFEHQPKDWSGDWFQPREGGRMALVTVIEAPAGDLLIYNTHLESRGDDHGRSTQLEEILLDIEQTGFRGPVLVAGDLNTSRGLQSPVFQMTDEHPLGLIPFKRALSNREARKQKDWLLAHGLESPYAVLHRDISASDHKPISAVLKLPTESQSQQ